MPRALRETSQVQKRAQCLMTWPFLHAQSIDHGKKLLLALLAVCALVLLLLRVKRPSTLRPRNKPVLRLRSAKEQRNPIDTAYNPKQFRRPRNLSG
jgi:hypothetical protein